MAVKAAVYGAAFGLMPIGWIILNVIFLYNLTSEKGDFARLQLSIRDISDRPAAFSCCSSPSASVPSSRARPASARRSP